ncbi:MAG: IgGFc-binding protein [Deltaproteobacteria bacterium]|nr:IgGFc-binding protein [Deltaproteobacteria bacterium]
MDRRAALLALFLATGLACKPPAPQDFNLPPGDVGTTDTGPGPVQCRPGMTLCNGNESYQCTADGEPVNRVACSGASPICVPGIGCRLCRPGGSRCDPMRPQQTQTCRSDGMGYDNGLLCNPSGGQTCNNGSCMDRCSDSALGRSYLGCDYWGTTTANGQLDARFEYAIVVSNPQTYPVEATVEGGALPMPRALSLRPGEVQIVRLPWVPELVEFNPALPPCRGGEPGGCAGNVPARSVLRPRGAYHLHANGPVAAYQFNPLNFERAGGYHSFTNDASLLLPQGVLTSRYIVSTAPNWRTPSPMGIFLGGFVAIVGVTGESTTVTVRLSASISAGAGVSAASAGTTQTYRLQPGDVVQLVGTGEGDLTGTTINATNPVAVFVGHDCTNVPNNRPACDHLEEQLFPNETWGREYVVSALRDRGPMFPSVIRIVSQSDNNQVTFDPPTVRAPATLRAGQVLEFATTASFRVAGTSALLVAQYMLGQGPASATSSGAGDPAMVFEVPSQQFRSSYDIYVPETYTSNFINVVAPVRAEVTMDGMPLRGSMETVGPWAVYYLPIRAGAHHLQSGTPFGIKVYGIAQYTSYMYPGGLDLQLITPG